MSRVLFVVHPGRPQGTEFARSSATRLLTEGHEVITPLESPFALDLPGVVPEPTPVDADYVVALGGDGTMLNAVSMLGGSPAPILAVNLGNLGYLTEIEPESLDDSLTKLLAGAEHGGWWVDERMMLDITVKKADGTTEQLDAALNEVVVEKSGAGHTIGMSVRIDGEAFTTYAADGMIVATPTGSTAYSLSVRGPVVSPKHRAILVTPVAPHMLFDRTLVLDPSERVEIELIDQRPASVAVDGRPQGDLEPGSSVVCRPADVTARFARFGNTPYHQVLKSKFGLSDR